MKNKGKKIIKGIAVGALACLTVGMFAGCEATEADIEKYDQEIVTAKEMLQNESFYLNGYTNGCLTYFPTEDEFDHGGYEVYWSMLIYYIYFDRVAPFVREAATDLVRFAVRNAPVWEH